MTRPEHDDRFLAEFKNQELEISWVPRGHVVKRGIPPLSPASPGFAYGGGENGERTRGL